MTRPLDKTLLRDLWHIKGQALAIAAVMACGVAIVVMTFGAMMSVSCDKNGKYLRQIDEMYFSKDLQGKFQLRTR